MEEKMRKIKEMEDKMRYMERNWNGDKRKDWKIIKKIEEKGKEERKNNKKRKGELMKGKK